MSADFCHTNDVIDENNLHQVPLRYMWSEDSAIHFQDTLTLSQ